MRPTRSRQAPSIRRSLLLVPVAALAFAAGGCESMDLAPGDLNDIYVAADPALWEQVGDTLRSALQPTVLTVIDELAFQVVPQDPGAPDWTRTRTFKQLLVVGTRDDPWVAPAVETYLDREESLPDLPALFRVSDVWSRNQIVTALVLPSDDPALVESRLPDLHESYDALYRDIALDRMFVSGRDSALADTLTREAGFTLLLPDVYQWSRRDSLYLFRNDNPSPDELIRQIVVTWRTPVPETLDSLFAPGPVLEWRRAVNEATVDYPHVVDTTRMEAGAMEYRGSPAYELQAIWRNPPEADWPAGGPFITRLVACLEQDRLYVLDAWLYAPGRDKYEYMIQLNTILDSFRCGGG